MQAQFTPSLISRFWSKVDKSGDCWNWTGTTISNGYGWIANGTKQRLYAHRVSWQLHYGLIPEGMGICHRCDNPSCVRPEHLFPGTQRDNMLDATFKGRVQKGEQHYRAKLSEADVRKIRSDPRRQRIIAADFNISQQTVHDIKAHKRWAWLI